MTTFIRLTKQNDDFEVCVNVDHIVTVSQDEDECFIRLAGTDYYLPVNETYGQVLQLLGKSAILVSNEVLADASA